MNDRIQGCDVIGNLNDQKNWVCVPCSYRIINCNADNLQSRSGIHCKLSNMCSAESLFCQDGPRPVLLCCLCSRKPMITIYDEWKTYLTTSEVTIFLNSISKKVPVLVLLINIQESNRRPAHAYIHTWSIVRLHGLLDLTRSSRDAATSWPRSTPWTCAGVRYITSSWCNSAATRWYDLSWMLMTTCWRFNSASILMTVLGYLCFHLIHDLQLRLHYFHMIARLSMKNWLEIWK